MPRLCLAPTSRPGWLRGATPTDACLPVCVRRLGETDVCCSGGVRAGPAYGAAPGRALPHRRACFAWQPSRAGRALPLGSAVARRGAARTEPTNQPTFRRADHGRGSAVSVSPNPRLRTPEGGHRPRRARAPVKATHSTMGGTRVFTRGDEQPCDAKLARTRG